LGHHRQPDDPAQLTRILTDHWACTVIVAVVPSCAVECRSVHVIRVLIFSDAQTFWIHVLIAGPGNSEIRILLQKTSDTKTSKKRMHLNVEADDIETEISRLETLGATRWDHQEERGFEFWVLRDP
jgi:hypothetical protein